MPESLLDRLKRAARLPTPPGTAIEILRLCQQEDLSITQLADTLAADPALSLRLLKYANSSMFGVRREVTNVRDAVLLLGIRSVRLMALSFSLLSQEDERACAGFDFTLFWSHSLGAAVAARYLVQRNDHLSPEEAFAAALLSQMGKLVFAIGLPEDYGVILKASGGTLGATAPYELTKFGTTYCELGAELIEHWGIPQRLATTIRYQQTPEEITEDPTQQAFTRLIGTAVRIADVLCENGSPDRLKELTESIVRSGMIDGEPSVEQTWQNIREEFSSLAQTLNLKGEFRPDVKVIQAEAGEVLGELSLAVQLKSEAVEKENQGLQEKAWTDGLTGISNRAAFDRHLAQTWDEAAHHGRSLGLILLDVDHFKKFNDRHGHRTGDAVLRSVASCLPRSVRQVDFVARYGGEEFAIILPRLDRLIAAQICVKIRKAIEAQEVEFEGRRHKVTASVGAVILTRVCNAFTPQALIEAADKQLYAAKHKGRNCCSLRQLEPAPSASRSALAGLGGHC